MKLSKKLIAALLTAAMVIAQVSVLPFAEVGAANPYKSGIDDGAYYFWRVPNKAADGAELPKNAAGRTYATADVLGLTEFAGAVGRNPDTGAYSKSGAVFIEEINGERFVEIDLDEDQSQCSNLSLDSSVLYDGTSLYPGEKGAPTEIDTTDIKAYAIRFKTTGIDPAQASGWELRVGDNTCPWYGYMRQFTDFEFIDINTRQTSRITYGRPKSEGGGNASYYTKGEMDGWIIVPFEAAGNFNAEKGAKYLAESWKNVTIHTHSGANSSCANNHSGGFSDWTNRKLYIGDSMFVTDIQKFVDAYTAPKTPELVKKYSDSITIVKQDKVTYSIAETAAPATILSSNETGEFTGLKENTNYTITAAWTDNHNAYKSQSSFTTDQEKPSLDTPVIVEGSLTDGSFAIEVIPGLEYALEGSDEYSESGIFEGLDPNTEYKVVGRNKKTGAKTSVLTVKTNAVVNPYDRGDGSSKLFTVPRDTDNYKPSYINGNFQKNDKNGLNIVEIDGERFVECNQKSGSQANIGVNGNTEWGLAQGIPREIWIKEFWGFGLRIKIDEAPEDLFFYLQMQLPNNEAYGNGWPYYLVDKTTGTWSKQIKNGQWNLAGFDGWIILPFSSILKDPDYTIEKIQSGFKAFNYYLRGGENYGTSSWVDTQTTFYMGDAVVIEDPQEFIDNYAPNSEEPILPLPRNEVTDKSIPAVMMNDCSGFKVGDGLKAIDKARANLTTVKKPNEESPAVLVNPAFGLSSLMLTNDALNYDTIPTELSWQVSDSIGIAFYVEIPEAMEKRAHFGVKVMDDATEYHDFGTMYFYYTVSNGVATKRYGSLEFRPGFKGYVMIPFNNFDFDNVASEMVDGLINSPDTIDAVGFTFDAETYPEMADVDIIIDDLMMYQDTDAFATAILKIQGAKDFAIVEDEKTYRIDDEPEIPKIMANDCTGVEIEDGIYDMDNIELILVDKKNSLDSYIDIVIGDELSSVMFENHAYFEDMSAEDLEKLYNAKGLSFKLNVPKDAPMIVGMDLEILEAETEYFLYDPNKFYYTVENGVVTQVYGYLEFDPGFDGIVVIPFESFIYDEAYSEFYDGELREIDLIDYFGFYFSTEYYAAIANTKISIDDIAFYSETFEYIDAIWAKQTGNGKYVPDINVEAGVEDSVDKSPVTGEATPIVAVAAFAAISAAAVAFSRKKKED